MLVPVKVKRTLSWACEAPASERTAATARKSALRPIFIGSCSSDGEFPQLLVLVPGHDKLLQDLDEEVERQSQQDDGEQRGKDAGGVELSRRVGEQVTQPWLAAISSPTIAPISA